MKTLIVSNRLKLAHPVSKTDIVSWDKRPSVEAYPVVILDINFGEPSEEGFARITNGSPRFYEMGSEVARCLKANGVVIACMGPIVVTPLKLTGLGHRAHTWRVKRDRLAKEHLPDHDHESSYDSLPGPGPALWCD